MFPILSQAGLEHERMNNLVAETFFLILCKVFKLKVFRSNHDFL